MHYMYAEGDGVPEDDEKAEEWFQLAIEQGHPRPNLIWDSSIISARRCREICGRLPSGFD